MSEVRPSPISPPPPIFAPGDAEEALAKQLSSCPSLETAATPDEGNEHNTTKRTLGSMWSAASTSPPKPPISPGLKLSELHRQGTRLTEPSEEDVLRSKEQRIARMSRGAIRQLEIFSNTQRPKATGVLVHGLHLAVQPVVALLPRCCGGGFYTELARIGGESRVRMLLKVASFDRQDEHALPQPWDPSPSCLDPRARMGSDRDGVISQKECVQFEREAASLAEMSMSAVRSRCLRW